METEMTPERIEEYVSGVSNTLGRERYPSEAELRAVRWAITQAVTEALESAAKACEQVYGGRAHTYASENADIYRAQDGAIASCAKVVRSLKPAGKGE